MRTAHKYPRSILPQLAIVGIVMCSAVASGETPSLSPEELVRRAVQNEIAANNDSAPHFMFKDQKKTPRVSQTKLMVETREATAGLLIAQDGHALTPQQQRSEEARLQNYVKSAEELNRKRKQEREDIERTARIVRALPDAFLYEADGTEPGTDSVGQPGDELVRLKFRANPGYDPPSRVEQVLTGMQGHLLIDAKENRIAEIDGTLEKEVGFGWGILGHLDRGGRFLVQQADVGNHVWEVTRIELDFTGRILFVKKLNIRSSDVFSEFHPVPSSLTFAQGVELLKKAMAEDQSAAGTKEQKREDPKTQETAADRVQGKDQAKEQLCCDR